MSSAVVYKQVSAALKKVLKERGLTYEQLAEKLDVSERTVKRMLNGDDCSLTKIAEACESIGIKFFDLMLIAQEEEEESFQLTMEQEEMLAASPEHYLIFTSLVNGVDFDSMQKRHGLSRLQYRRFLKDLEQMQLLTRGRGDDYELNVSGGGHYFISGGPLQNTIGHRDMQQYLENVMGRVKGVKASSTGSGTEMTQESIDNFIAEMSGLAEKYRLIAQRERSVFSDDKLQKVRWLLGITWPFESWIYDIRFDGADEKI